LPEDEVEVAVGIEVASAGREKMPASWALSGFEELLSSRNAGLVALPVFANARKPPVCAPVMRIEVAVAVEVAEHWCVGEGSQPVGRIGRTRAQDERRRRRIAGVL
jgi:hypothetical protein